MGYTMYARKTGRAASPGRCHFSERNVTHG